MLLNLPLLAGLGFLALLALLLPSETSPTEAAPSPSTPPPPAVDLRPRFEERGLVTRPQGARGTCSVFAVIGALEYALAAHEGRGTALSVEFLNWAAHRAANRRADGGFFSELWDGFREYGVCPEEALPYRAEYDADLQPPPTVLAHAKALRSVPLRLHWIKEWDVRTGMTEAQLARVRATLAAGWPVCGGLRWPKKPHWDAGVLRVCGQAEVYDGHSVLLVGYRPEPAQPGGGVFLIRNSGSPARDGALPYAYVRDYLNDAAFVTGGTDS